MLKCPKSLDISEKEWDSYLVLCKYGTRQISFVSKKAGLNRGTTYVALHSLLAKGFVSKNVKKKVQYFTAVSPEKLTNYLESKESLLQQDKATLVKVVEFLKANSVSTVGKPQLEFFEGSEGARVALLDTLSAQDSYLRAFLSIGDIADFVGATFFEEFTNKRVSSGPGLRAIRTLEKDKEAMGRNPYAKRYVSSKKDRREVRYISQDLAFPMSIYIYDDKILTLSSKEESFALILRSRELADMQKKLFDAFWNLATPDVSKAS